MLPLTGKTEVGIYIPYTYIYVCTVHDLQEFNI